MARGRGRPDLLGPGSVVAVTGASRGIGRAVARAAAARGATVGLLARPSADLDALAAELGPRAVAVPADVADPDVLRSALAGLEVAHGRIDVLVANAGIGAYGPFLDIDPDEIERLVRVNVLGTLHAVQAVAPGMVARRRGHIVVVGSIAGRIGSPFEATYAATKFAQVGFAEALSVELSPYDVGVSTVNPGPVDTGFFDARGHAYERPWPKKVPAEEVAAAVLAAVDAGRLERTIPRALAASVVVRHVIPRLFGSGTRRTFRQELAADAARR